MNFEPKLTRQTAYDLYLEYQKTPFNIAAKAREIGISSTRIRQQFKKIARIIKHQGQRGLQNYLAYRWKSGSGYSISPWKPTTPPLEGRQKR